MLVYKLVKFANYVHSYVAKQCIVLVVGARSVCIIVGENSFHKPSNSLELLHY